MAPKSKTAEPLKNNNFRSFYYNGAMAAMIKELSKTNIISKKNWLTTDCFNLLVPTPTSGASYTTFTV